MTEKTKPFTETKLNKKEKSIKSISLIKRTNQNNDKNKKFLGIKRKLFKKINNKKEKKKKFLSIAKSSEYFIKKSNFQKQDDICIICLDKISFQKKHFLHCGHYFHCYCINKWINMDKNKCPLCKQDIKCNESTDDSIGLEEDEENNDSIIINNYNSDLQGSFRFLKIYCIVVMILFIIRECCFQSFIVY